MEIKVFGATYCSNCQRAKRFFQSENVTFEYIDIETPDGRAKFDEFGLSSIPVIVMNDEILVGFQPDKVKEILTNSQ